MVEVIKLTDSAAGPCTPGITLFDPEGSFGILTNVFIGSQSSPVMVQGDKCIEVACPSPCIPTLVNPAECCSTTVFAGPNSLPVAKVTGVLTCGYVAGVTTPSLVNVN